LPHRVVGRRPDDHHHLHLDDLAAAPHDLSFSTTPGSDCQQPNENTPDVVLGPFSGQFTSDTGATMPIL